MSGFRWTVDEVARALGVEPTGGAAGVEAFSAVSTDTRSIPAGSLFVALQGASFDAHDFLGKAAASGAAGAVVSRIPDDAPSIPCFVVDDTRAALGRLGRHLRRARAARVVAVAGSNGKTSTKDLLRAALSARLRVHATEANLNNQVGVPLTLLAIPDDAEAAVVEVGTNVPGEVGLLTRFVEPDAAIVTSIGEEHLEGLGSLEGVLEEELAILEGVRDGGSALVAEEPPELPARARGRLGADRVRVAGFGEGAELRPEGGEAGIRFRPDGSTDWRWRGVDVHVPLPGRHNVRNALLALGLAAEWGVPPEDAARGIAAMPRPKMRNEWRQAGGIRILADCYNANPPSVRAAVDLIASIPADGDKVAVLGTMKEMGAAAAAVHRDVAAAVADAVERGGVSRVVATGEFVDAFAPHRARLGARLVAVDDVLEAYDAARPHLKGDETILLKGSRGVALERWLPLLERDFADGGDGARAGEPDREG